jgi:uncharacterized protein Yka (UPF0111/DUF47 family)
MALFNFLPKEEQYFVIFSRMTSYIYDAAHELVEMLNSPSSDYDQHSRRIKAFEHECDREDIYLLSGALDDIVDLIDDAARAMVMYDIRETSTHARRFADVLQRMAIQLHEAVSMMEKPNGINPRLVELHRLENEGDDIYHAAIAELFKNATDALYVIKWKDIYEKLEAAIDRCENVASIIESVIIKNA